MNSSATPRTLRILLIEDNEDDQVIVRDLFDELPSIQVEMEWAPTYDAGYQQLTTGQYDVCLVDYLLGQRTGLELLRAIPAEDRGPVILLVGSENYMVDHEAAHAGAADYLVKGRINALLLERSIRYAMERKASESALRHAQRFAQATVDALPDNIAVIDEGGTIIAVNAAWRTFAEVNGFIGADAGVGTNYLDVCEASATQESHAVLVGIHDVMEGRRELFSLEYSCDSPDGLRWFQLRATRFAGADPVHVVVSHTNISDRKQAEIQLLKSEANLAKAQQIAHLGSWEMELDFSGHSGERTLHWSEETFRILGFRPGEVEPTYNHFLRVVHPDDISHVEAVSRQAIRECSAFELEHRVLLPGGGTRIVHEVAEIYCDEAGIPRRMVGTVQDVTARKRAEAELERFFTLSLDLLCIADFHTNFKRVNPAFTSILGYSEAELVEKPFLTLVHPDDLETTRSTAQNVIVGQEITSFENRYRTKSGSWRWLEWKSVTSLEEGLIYAAARDITERKESEFALRAMRDQLEARVLERTLELEQANEALRIQVAERELAESQASRRARQQEAVADLGRRALTEFSLGELFDFATELVTATLEVDLSSVLELQPGGDDFRIRAGRGWKFADPATVVIPGHQNSQAGYCVMTGAPVVVVDKQSETRFSPWDLALAHGVVSGVAVLIRHSDQPFGTLAAYASCKREFDQDDVNFLQSTANVLATAIQRHGIEEEIRVLNEQLREANLRLLAENEDRQHALVALRETTDVLEEARRESERAREQAEVANRAKSEFLSRMSHELRTPLNAILGFGQLLQLRGLPPKENKGAEQILKAGQHLLQLINEILAISRIEAGRISVSIEPVEVEPLFHDLINMLRPLAASRKITLVDQANTPAGNGENAVVMADRQRLHQVLLNLASNAIKYNYDGGEVTLSVQKRQLPSEVENGVARDVWRIAVQDTGPGIDPQNQEVIFQPFERLGKETTSIEGTGIGLTLVKSLVTVMHGRVGVDSQPGQGSTFWVDLPSAGWIPVSPPQLDSVPDKILAVGQSKDQSRSILYVEDNAANLEVMASLFENMPQFQLLSAIQGNIGLDLARQHHPDLILLDLHLPDIQGDEVLRQLKADANTRAIPVVIVSADATPKQIERLLTQGAKYYLTKPIDFKRLFQILEDTI